MQNKGNAKNGTISRFNSNKGINTIRSSNEQVAPTVLYSKNGLSGFTARNNYNAINNYQSNFVMQRNIFGPVDNSNEHNDRNKNYDMANHFAGNRFEKFPYTNVQESFINDGNKSNRLNESMYNLPDNFFASDGVYQQKDLMQKPLVSKSFRRERKTNKLPQKFKRSDRMKNVKSTKNGNQVASESNCSSNKTCNVKKISNEPKIYVPNPKAKIDGKLYIPKPKVPEQNLDISKEEKKQQWKEYRQAMKPFKNREFYNAKRVVQRLGKKAPTELDEKQTIRLTKAREIMEAHKARLSAKYANYIKAESSSTNLGELYVLKNKPPNDSTTATTTILPSLNYGNFGQICPHHGLQFGHNSIETYTCFNEFATRCILHGTVTGNNL